jgi:hypothetical protein
MSDNDDAAPGIPGASGEILSVATMTCPACRDRMAVTGGRANCPGCGLSMALSAHGGALPSITPPPVPRGDTGDTIVRRIRLDRTELIPGACGALIGYSDQFPDKQFLVIPSEVAHALRNKWDEETQGFHPSELCGEDCSGCVGEGDDS